MSIFMVILEYQKKKKNKVDYVLSRSRGTEQSDA